MKKLSEYYDYLKLSIPLLHEFRYGDCCEHARMKSMSIALNDVYTDLEIGSATRKQIKENPILFYDELRKIILTDSTLNPTEKLDLVKLM